MSPNRRIFLNIIATYGRSLYALILGLFSARWALMALGQVDYGLYGVVGGLTAFIAFFNGLLATAVGRFYAVSIGEAEKKGAEGLETCRQWFSIAVFIHTVIPVLLMAAGYPLGEWAVRNWLTIPPDRIEESVWVFRFVCLACFVGMVNIPFQAMYTAKQYIAELTIYSFATTTLNFFFLYYMVSNPGDWLAKYAFWGMLMSVVPQLIICIRAVKVFPECRFRLHYVGSSRKFKELFCYAGWQSFGCLGAMLRTQGIAVLVNKYFGPKVNSAMTLGSSVASHADTLSSSLIGAFQPAMFSSIFGCNARFIRPTNVARAAMFARIQEFALQCVTGDLFVDNVKAALNSFERGETVSFDQSKIARLRDRSLSWLKSALTTDS